MKYGKLNHKPSFIGRSALLALLVLFVILSIRPAGAQTWSALGTGVDGYIYATTIYNGQLIAAGEFSTAGSVPASNIARWNGTSWDSLGPGLNGRVDALAVFEGELIAGGQFSKAGSLDVFYIAAWNGTAWSAHMGAMNGAVKALLPFGANLVAGGSFHMAGGVDANHIAGYNSSAGWFVFGSGIAGANDDVLALAEDGSSLYAGGAFTLVDDNNVNHIARWTGTAWSAMGTGVGGVVYSMVVFNSEIVAGGLFTTAGGNPAANIARWNGTAWLSLDNGTGGFYPYVLALRSYHNALYAGGLFTTASGLTVNGVAKWNGSAWSAMAGGVWNPGPLVDGSYTLAQFNSNLVAGGTFFNAGPLSNVGNIAAWNEPAVRDTLDIGNDTVKQGEHPCYNATHIIRVAGGTQHFIVGSGGVATLIAGEAIHFLEGTKVLAGGHLTGMITTNGQYCNTTPSMALMSLPGEDKPATREAQVGIRIYPNPAGDHITLDLGTAAPEMVPATIRITDAAGAGLITVQACREKNCRISLEGLPAGFYLLQVVAGNTSHTLKFVRLAH
jgi:trimeric autotransporter adhesin